MLRRARVYSAGMSMRSTIEHSSIDTCESLSTWDHSFRRRIARTVAHSRPHFESAAKSINLLDPQGCCVEGVADARLQSAVGHLEAAGSVCRLPRGLIPFDNSGRVVDCDIAGNLLMYG